MPGCGHGAEPAPSPAPDRYAPVRLRCPALSLTHSSVPQLMAAPRAAPAPAEAGMRRRAAAGERGPPRQRRCPRSLGRGGGGEERRRYQLQLQLRLAREGEPRRRLGEERGGSGWSGGAGTGAAGAAPESRAAARRRCRARSGPALLLINEAAAGPRGSGPRRLRGLPKALSHGRERRGPGSPPTQRAPRPHGHELRFLRCLHHSSTRK